VYISRLAPFDRGAQKLCADSSAACAFINVEVGKVRVMFRLGSRIGNFLDQLQPNCADELLVFFRYPAKPRVLLQMIFHPGRAASEKFRFGFCRDPRTGAQSITKDSQRRCVRGICQSNGRTGGCSSVRLASHAREVTSVAEFTQRRLIGVTKIAHSFSSTDKIFPAGSLNQAIDGPPLW